VTPPNITLGFDRSVLRAIFNQSFGRDAVRLAGFPKPCRPEKVGIIDKEEQLQMAGIAAA
jgi:hypothetical protein